MVQFARVKDLLELPEHLSKSAFVLKRVSFIARAARPGTILNFFFGGGMQRIQSRQDREPPHAVGDRISAAGY